MEKSREKKARITGIALTLVLHAGALALVSFTGLSYIYPPPQEQAMLIDFSEEEPVIQQLQGREPRAAEVDLTRPVELAQKSESPEVSKSENLTPETAPDDFGDVPVPTPEPKSEPKLDPRASFPGMAKKDTSLTAPHAASEASDQFKAGQAAGNTAHGRSAYYSIAACATASMFLIQLALNVFGSVDILPFTGVTFPFVSRGGTSVLSCWMLLAFIKAGDTRKGASFVVKAPDTKQKEAKA